MFSRSLFCTVKLCVILAVAAMLTANTVNAESKRTSTSPIIKTFQVEDQTITLMIPEFAVSGNDSAIGITLKVIVDVTDLKGTLVAQMNKRWKYDECGERFETRGATVRPGENGQLHVSVTAQAQRWKCVKTKIPKVRWEVKRVGPIKTKVPQFYSEMKTAKTRLVSQSIHLEALIRAVLNGDTVTADVNVTKAMPSGLAKHFVKAFGLHDKIKNGVQSKIEERLPWSGSSDYRNKSVNTKSQSMTLPSSILAKAASACVCPPAVRSPLLRLEHCSKNRAPEQADLFQIRIHEAD